MEQRDKRSGHLSGLTDNYLRVTFEGPDALCGRLAPVLIRSATELGTLVKGVPFTGDAGAFHVTLLEDAAPPEKASSDEETPSSASPSVESDDTTPQRVPRDWQRQPLRG